jgi:gliding motility-associated-like protein
MNPKTDYTPGANDIAAGIVTLTVTTDDPDGTGPCIEATAQVDLIIDAQQVPTFTQLGPYCIDDVPDVLPLNSIEGFAGTWDGPINTTIEGVTIYTFTPFDNCIRETTMSISVFDVLIATFIQLGPYCINAMPDELPIVSENGIEGSWDSAILTDMLGTETYTFTPDADCAVPVTMDVEIISSTTAHAELTSTNTTVCPGECVDVTFGVSGGNGGPYDVDFIISAAGLSFPFTIPLSTVDGMFTICSTTDFLPSFSGNTLFIPELFIGLQLTLVLTDITEGGCQGTFDANPITIDFIDPILPAFAQLGPFCQNDVPDMLPTMSINGVTGTWDGPIDTSTPGIISYTFMSTELCTEDAMMDVEILMPEDPLFNINDTYCLNDNPDLLPPTSDNGITGTWDGPIDTSTPGLIIYTFTADDCATDFMLEVEVIDIVFPSFDQLGPFCNTETMTFSLPSTSLEGIDGIWTPTDQVNPSALNLGINVFAFTPSTMCDEMAFMEILIEDCTSNCMIDLGGCSPNLGNPACNTGSPGGTSLIGTDEQGPSGSNQCIEVSVQNFADVQSMEANFIYDGSLISFTGAQNFCQDVVGLGMSNLGTFDDGMGMDTIRLVWFDFSAANPVTLADGKVLFELCFDLIGANGSFVDIVFTDVEIADSNQQPLALFLDCGSIDICDATIENNVACNDNGTPNDTSDDFITFDLNPTGMDLGTGYMVTSSLGTVTPVTGNYGFVNSFQLDNGSANGSDITITVTDNDDVSCLNTLEISSDPCSIDPSCDITAMIIGAAICNDNGTPCDETDDFFSYQVEILNTAGLTGWTANDPLATAGDYNTSIFTFGPYPSTGGDINVEIIDNDDVTCLATLTLTAVLCSDEELSIEDLGTRCDDNGTDDPSDDFYFIDLIINGTAGLGTDWTSNDLAQPNGPFGVMVSFGPYPIFGASVLLEFTDATGTCLDDMLVESPLPCSTTCSLEGSIENVICDDNGTPLDGSDDTFEFILNTIGTNAGTAYMIQGDATLYPYLNNVQIGPFAVGDGSPQMFTLVDVDDPSCTTEITVDPSTCVVFICSIEAEVLNIECDANGTPDDPTDDLFTYEINVTPTNSTATGWESSSFQDGTYVAPAMFGPVPIAGVADFMLTIFDGNDPLCTAEVFVDVPEPCSVDCATEPVTGMGRDTTICGSDEMLDLFVLLTGGDIGGVWFLDGQDLPDNILDLGTLLPTTYEIRYQVNMGTPCQSTETMELIIREPIDLEDVTLSECLEIILPPITGTALTGNEAYFDAPDGMGNMLNVGDVITMSTTIYTFDQFGDCEDTGIITIDIIEPSIDNPGPIEECNMYVLPVITGELSGTPMYFEGQGGTGNSFDAGDIISETMDLYMYFMDGNCMAEELLSITILDEINVTLDPEICPDEEVIVNGEVYNQDMPQGVEFFVTAAGCDSIVTIDLQLLSNQAEDLDTFVCNGDMLVIGGEIFDENNTSGTVSIPNEADNGCDVVLMVELVLQEDALGTLDLTLCPEDVIELEGVTFDINNPTGEFIIPGGAANGCDSIVMVFAEFELPDLSFTIEPLLDGISQQITIITDSPPTSISWNPTEGLSCTDCLNPIFNGLTDEVYTATLSYGSGCEDSLVISIPTLFRIQFYVPNIFSPNGDGFNDVFFVQGIDDIGTVTVMNIYDRWGELIFEAENTEINDESQGWDGFFKDRKVVNGVYTYYIEVVDANNDPVQLSGNVTVIE